MAEPVTLTDMRSHLGISQQSDTSRDVIITRRITSARILAESITKIAIVPVTITARSRKFPDTNGAINLQRPLVAVTSITYIDTNGIRQTLSNSNYDVDSVSCKIDPAYGVNWPQARDKYDAVIVTYSAGFINHVDVPINIIEAIEFTVAQWELFQASIESGLRPLDMPNAAKQLLEPSIDYRKLFSNQDFTKEKLLI